MKRALIFILLVLMGLIYSKEIVCGIANGYPPYQFFENSTKAGLDVDIANNLFSRLKIKFRYNQANWDDVVNQLRTSKIDIIAGMGINDTREKYFDFSISYYKRYEIIAVRKDSSYKNAKDLIGKIITGDRHSYVENMWQEKGIRDNYRILQTDSKKESMKLLKENRVEAVIMPRAVAIFLAKESKTDIRIIDVGDPGVPVAFAVTKGNKILLDLINVGLESMIEDNTIDDIYNIWADKSK